MTGLLAIENNRKFIPELLDKRGNLVPFIGAGFSQSFCPGWEDFLTAYFAAMKLHGELLPQEIAVFEKLADPGQPNRLEVMADFLVEKSGPVRFKDELLRQMQVTVPFEKIKKFHLLHAAFPYLKITTNFDRLIETVVPYGVYTEVAYGYENEKIDGFFTKRLELDCLVKIHGGISHMNSIVLSAEQYRKLYGHKDRYHDGFGLPGFLKRVFTNAPVLFMGCSLEWDRTAMILGDIEVKPRHFAVMKLPGPDKREEKILVQRRLSKMGICTIWLEDFGQIGELLVLLAGEAGLKVIGTGDSLPVVGPFVGRVKELEAIAAHLEYPGETGGVQAITGRLYSIDGAGGVGKTALALEAARRSRDKFKDGVLPLFRADAHTPVSFAMALAAYFNIELTEPPDAGSARLAITHLLQNRRCLLILDNVEKWEDLRFMIPLRTPAGILVTSRNRDIYKKLRNHFQDLRVEEIALEKFTPEEALELFKEMLGPEFRVQEKDIYLEIARDLGFLPLALRQAASLMVYTPHYPPADLRDKLKSEGRLDLLRQGCTEAESDSRVIETVFDLSAPLLTAELKDTLAMLAICSPGPVPLDFLRRLAKDKDPGLAERLERLHTYSWCDRREREGLRYYELHQLVRELVRAPRRGDPEKVLRTIFRRPYWGAGDDNPYRAAFIREVHEIFTADTVHFSVKERYVSQLEEAFNAMVQQEDPRLKDWLYSHSLYYFCTFRGYGHFYVRLTGEVERVFPGDKWALRAVYGNRALILQGWGKLEEAMTLHQKQEKICEEFGDRAGLSRSYGNQALILKAWGRLEEAMTHLKKQEAICEELGDRAGLSRSYGNQALILSDWGRLEEAMTLHQKEEAICEELGDRAGLATCYGNQASIKYLKGEFEAAMKLYQKQEAICEELGDRAGLSKSYCGQALILSDWGRLEEAMTLQKKNEKIKEELGDRAGLAICWWNQGCLYEKQGDGKTQARLWQKAIDTNRSMGIPTIDDEKKLVELMEKMGKK